jgi:uncharacterized protein YyaL (SSP411 family)
MLISTTVRRLPPLQDADSLDTDTNKKSEGAFYVWTHEEIIEVLGQERASVFCEVYGVKPGGNCTLSARSDPHKEFIGKNVLAQVGDVRQGPMCWILGLKVCISFVLRCTA